MKRYVEINPGDRYGFLTIIQEVEAIKRVRRFLCKCDCGNTTVVRMCHLRSVKKPTVSCGCFSRSIMRTSGYKHGFASDKYKPEKLYRVWSYMKERCNNPNTDHYRLYGGRGIIVCEEWQHDYLAFRIWAYNNGYKEGLTIDRINPNGNYKPLNCRWITKKEQQHNLRTNVNITYMGETHCIAEWARITGILEGTIRQRYKKGLPVEDMFYKGNLRLRGQKDDG